MSKNVSDFANVLKTIIENSEGKDTLGDKIRTKNFLSDFAPGNSFQKEKKLLDDAYSCNAIAILLNADSSLDGQKKAIEIAKEKLIDNMSISEERANSILKDICDALGWNTNQLFNNNFIQQVAVSKKECFSLEKSTMASDVSEVEQYSMEYAQSYNMPTQVRQNTEIYLQSEPQAITIVPKQKKKSTLVTVLKVIGILLVISVIYNKITGTNDDDNSIIENAKILAETEKQSAENDNLEADDMTSAVKNENTTMVTESVGINNDKSALVSNGTVVTDNNYSINTEAFVATITEQTTTYDPSAEKYVVTDIAKLGYKINKVAYFSPTFMTYDKDTNVLYYLSDSGDLYEYIFSNKSDNLVIKSEEIIKGIKDDYDGFSLDDDDITIKGVVYNTYNNKVYIYGILKPLYTPDTWIYEAESGEICRFQNDVGSIYFFNKDEFVATTSQGHGSGWYIVNFTDSESKEWHSIETDGKVLTQVFETNDYYYCITANYSSSQFDFYEIKNINSSNSNNKIFSKNDSAYGIDVKDNEFYFKDSQNNILKISLNDMSEEEYISIHQVYQTGKSYLSTDSCSGLYLTNDGSFITYDTVDGKIKYVTMN